MAKSSTARTGTDGERKSVARGPGSRLYGDALTARNVFLAPSQRDAYLDTIKSKLLKWDNSLHPGDEAFISDPSSEEEEEWRDDIDKCLQENESVYQRTVMMYLFKRRWLKKNLDWVSENLWNCPKPPSNAEEVSGLVTGRPRPDLIVAFQRSRIIDDEDSFTKPLPTLNECISPERKGSDASRAFPFFFIEAKKAFTEPNAARDQCLNDASYALHNIWKLLQLAGGDFSAMDNVRVFTVAAHGRGILIRVHRAQPLKNKAAYIEPGYPWGFQHVNFLELKEVRDQYPKARVCRIIRNILYEYGVKVLLHKLRQAVETIVTKANTAAAAGNDGHPQTVSSSSNQPTGRDEGGLHASTTGADDAARQSPQASDSGSEASTAQDAPRRSSRKRSAAVDPNVSFESRGSKTSRVGRELGGLRM